MARTVAGSVALALTLTSLRSLRLVVWIQSPKNHDKSSPVDFSIAACKSEGDGWRNFHVSKYNCIAASNRSVPK